jgi:hypothetical protein
MKALNIIHEYAYPSNIKILNHNKYVFQSELKHSLSSFLISC